MYYTMTNGQIMVAVTVKGAELLSMVNHEAGNKEYIWVGNEKYWDGHGPSLFPIVGRVKNGKYMYKGKEYSIMSPHGFVWVSDLNLIEHSDNSMTFNIKSSMETKKSYPFDFDYKIKYSIEGKKLRIDYTITNTSETETMIFALGAHPGFNVPLCDGEKFDDYYLEFGEACKPNEVLCEKAFLLGKTKPYQLVDDKILPLHHNLFDNDAILLQDCSRKITLRSKTGPHGATVNFPDFKYVGIWHTNETDAPFICIEPWNGVPSLLDAAEDLETKHDMMRLEPQGVYKVGYDIEIF
ncbi:MAG: aldose epimerase [Clostridiales bacterium]|nr:MAG: aldose epimerase [Clostridiales bacterium]